MEHSNEYKINLLSIKEDAEYHEYRLDDKFFEIYSGYAVVGGDLDAKISVEPTGNVYSVSVSYQGEVEAICDRCLDSVYYDVEFEKDFIVKLHNGEYEEDEDIINIPSKDAILDIGHIMIEDLCLELPMVLMHEDGECNPEMISKLAALSIDKMPEDGIEKDEDGVDLRWEALKKLK